MPNVHDLQASKNLQKQGSAGVPASEIERLWKEARPVLFNGTESELGIEHIRKMAAYCDRAVVKIGAFGADTKTEADFDLLKKPVEEFCKSYVVFLGTLTAMGCGQKAGESLRTEILGFGDQVAAAYASIERIFVARDPAAVSSLPKKAGILIDLLKKWERVPRKNHIAVKKRLIARIQQLRDVSRELIPTNDENSDDEGPEISVEERMKTLPLRVQRFAALLSVIESALKKFIHAVNSDEILDIRNLEAAYKSVDAIMSKTDELGSLLQDDVDDDDFLSDEDGEAEDDGAQATGNQLHDEGLSPEDRAEVLMALEKLEAELLQGKFMEASKALLPPSSGEDETNAICDVEIALRALKDSI